MAKITPADIKIRAEDATKAGIASAKKGVGGLTKAVMSYGAEMAAAYLLVKKAISVVKDLTQAYGVQELAVVGMESALRATGKYTPQLSKTLQDLASDLQDVTTYGDEVTLSAISTLQSLADLNEEGIVKTIPLIQDFAAGFKNMGMTMETAASLFGKTLGSTTNALTRYGIVIDMSGTKAERLAGIQEQMTAKFGGRAVALADTYAGKIEMLGNVYGDLKESIGGLMAHRIEPMIPLVIDLVGKLGDWAQRILDVKTAKEKLNQVTEGTIQLTKLEILLLEQEIASDLMRKLAKQEVTLQTDAYAMAISRGLKEMGAEIDTTEDLIMALQKEMRARTNDIENLQQGIKAREDHIDVIDDETAAIIAFDESMVMSGITLTNYMEQLDSARESTKYFKEETEELITEEDKLRQAYANSAEGLRDLAEARAGYTLSVKDSEEATWSLKDAQDEMNEAQLYFNDLMVAMAGAVTEGGNALKEMAKTGLAIVLTSLGKILIAQAILSWYRPVRAAAMLAGGIAAIAAANYIQTLQQGGIVKKQLGGYGGGDTVPALLEPGEMVIRKEVVRENRSALDAMNAGEQGMVQVNVYLGTKKIYSDLTKAIRNKQIPLYRGAIVD